MALCSFSMQMRTAFLVAMTLLLPWAAASCAQQREKSLPEAYPGYTGDYPGFTLRLDERFNRFDPEVWAKGDGAVGSEAMCRFTAAGVQVVEGVLELVIREEHVPASWSKDHQGSIRVHNLAIHVSSGRLTAGMGGNRRRTRRRAP